MRDWKRFVALICRIGSLEILDALVVLFLGLICRIGSLENADH